MLRQNNVLLTTLLVMVLAVSPDAQSVAIGNTAETGDDAAFVGQS